MIKLFVWGQALDMLMTGIYIQFPGVRELGIGFYLFGNWLPVIVIKALACVAFALAYENTVRRNEQPNRITFRRLLKVVLLIVWFPVLWNGMQILFELM